MAPLGRGGRGGCHSGGGVVNGGLWWPEEALKAVGLALLLLPTGVLRRRRVGMSFWCIGEACGDE